MPTAANFNVKLHRRGKIETILVLFGGYTCYQLNFSPPKTLFTGICLILYSLLL